MTLSARRQRQTLGGQTDRLEGIGLHSGAAVWVAMSQGTTGSGIVLRDHASGQEIRAIASNVFDTTRCTQLQSGGVIIQTVEHVLSAIAALGVDDAVIEISGGELPAADGSAAPFLRLAESVGVVDGEGDLDAIVVEETIEVTDGRGGSIRVAPANESRYSVALEYPDHPYLGAQNAAFRPGADSYAEDIAPARTFGFLSEIEHLRAHNLALGASYENALVLGETGYLNDCRFTNELARHKLLDLIGDLSLIGRPLIADVSAVRPGHYLNTKLAARLSAGGLG